jgi:hypothetical protein
MVKHILSSSMEVIRATDIRVCDRRLVYYPAVHALACKRGRGAGARFAIQSILQNGMQGLVGVAVDVKCPFAGGIKARSSEGFGQAQDAHASSISLLWMSPLAHDHLNKGFYIWPDLGGAAANAFRRPICTEAMVGGHVVADGGMLAISRGPLMRGNTLTFMINLDRTCRDADPKLLAQKRMGH